MSNTAVGSLYQKVIAAVVDASRTDFEENGVDPTVLEQLQRTWQQRLSDSKRATFPWDPPAELPQQTTAEKTSNGVKQEAATPAQSQPSPSPNSSQQARNGAGGTVQIKQEPGTTYDTSFLNLPQNPSYPQGIGQYNASQRAAMHLQQQYGSQASGSISALQAQANANANQQRQYQNQGQLNQGGSQQPRPPQPQQYQQNQFQQRPLPQSQYQHQPTGPQVKPEPLVKQEPGSLGAAQTDGAGEWDAIIARRNAHGDDEPLGRIAIDHMIRREVEAMQQRLEAGGLLVPLDERKKTASSIGIMKNTKAARTDPASNAMPSVPPQLDGPGDDSPSPNGGEPADEDEEDEDAINSDLDDSEDELNEDIEGDYEGDRILCLYDKVQRVKSKWKCTLKDGVVTVDGKDYVFHKASGEFEW